MPILLLLASLAFADDDAPPPGALAGSGAPVVADEEIRREGQVGAWAQIQTRITLLDQDVQLQADPATYGDPEDDPGFGLTRARLGLDGYVPLGDLSRYHQVEWAVALGVASPYDVLGRANTDVQLVDAFGRWTGDAPIGPTSVSVGLQRVPFNRGNLFSSADLLFQERDVASEWLGPSRDVGAVAAQAVELGETALVLVRGGAFNGNGQLFGDADPGLLSVGRLELVVGDAYRTWSPDREHALGVGLAAMNNRELATTTNALAADVLARFSLVTVTAEFIRSAVAPTDTVVMAPSLPEQTVRQGFAAQLSVWVPFDDDNGLEIGGRLSTFDDATHLDNRGDVQIVHGGLTWRNPLPGVDIGGGYVKRLEPNGEVSNDSIRLWTQIRPRMVLD